MEQVKGSQRDGDKGEAKKQLLEKCRERHFSVSVVLIEMNPAEVCFFLQIHSDAGKKEKKEKTNETI